MKTFAATLLILFTVTCSAFAADKPEVLKPTLANVSYGPHAANVIDFWKAEGEGPRPLMVYIHGGGWIGGTKKSTQPQ